MKTKIWFDLEETLIDNWRNSKILLKAPRIVKLANSYTNDFLIDVGIFSYAIYNNDDRNDFESRISPILLNELNIYSENVPTVELIKRTYEEYHDTKLFNNVQNFIKNVPKWQAFLIYNMTNNIPNMHHVLFDDTVPNMKIELTDIGSIVEFVHV